MREHRLGDIIDDFCVKCKRIMNHAIVSMLNGDPAKVRCRTCHNDHDYRHEQAPPPKVDARKAALFNEVLAKVAPSAPTADDDGEDALAEDIMAEEPLAEDLASEEEIAIEDEAGDPETPPAEPPKKALPAKKAKPAAKTASKPAAKTAKAKAKSRK